MKIPREAKKLAPSTKIDFYRRGPRTSARLPMKCGAFIKYAMSCAILLHRFLLSLTTPHSSPHSIPLSSTPVPDSRVARRQWADSRLRIWPEVGRQRPVVGGGGMVAAEAPLFSISSHSLLSLSLGGGVVGSEAASCSVHQL